MEEVASALGCCLNESSWNGVTTIKEPTEYDSALSADVSVVRASRLRGISARWPITVRYIETYLTRYTIVPIG